MAAGDTWLAVDGERIIYQATHSHVIYSLIRPRNGCAPERTFSRRNGLRQTWDWEPWEARSPAVASIPSCRPFHHDDGAWAVHREQLAEMAHHLPIITLLPDMVKFMTGHTPTLLKSSLSGASSTSFMDHITGVLADERAVARLAGGMIGKLGMDGFESSIRSLGYALGAVKDILQFVLVQSGKLGAAEMAARVNTIRQVAARVGNAIDDPTATKIVNEIVASAAQFLPIVTKTHQEIVRLGRSSGQSASLPALESRAV